MSLNCQNLNVSDSCVKDYVARSVQVACASCVSEPGSKFKLKIFSVLNLA